jgi:hypothetical protein
VEHAGAPSGMNVNVHKNLVDVSVSSSELATAALASLPGYGEKPITSCACRGADVNPSGSARLRLRVRGIVLVHFPSRLAEHTDAS